VRDYIQVTDLANAHVPALDALKRGAKSTSCNCGYGHGLSVRDVVSAVERVVGRPLPVREGPRHVGDSPILVADPGRIRRELGWAPRHDDFAEIVRSALVWERRLNR
jgi:UDP-glucose 4-epimerase